MRWEFVDGAAEAVLLISSWITSDGAFVVGSPLRDSLVVSLTPSIAVVSLMERSVACVIDSFLVATLGGSEDVPGIS
jgi:hypothetical protein